MLAHSILVIHTNYIIQMAFDTTMYIPFVILHTQNTQVGVRKRLERSRPGMALLGKLGLLLRRGEFNKGPVRDAQGGKAILVVFLP
jgi:hypothetical protein